MDEAVGLFQSFCVVCKSMTFMILQVHIVALDVFNGKKFEDICPSTHNMEVPVVSRSEYTAVSYTHLTLPTTLEV